MKIVKEEGEMGEVKRETEGRAERETYWVVREIKNEKGNTKKK